MQHGFKVFIGVRYLGGLIGDNESKQDFTEGLHGDVGKKIHTISKTSVRHLQEIYFVVA